MNAKAVFLFLVLLFVSLNFCSSKTTEYNHLSLREKRQWNPFQGGEFGSPHSYVSFNNAGTGVGGRNTGVILDGYGGVSLGK